MTTASTTPTIPTTPGKPARRPGPLPNALGRWLSRLYGRVVEWRNQRYERSGTVWKVPKAVISVGNLSVGGTGKTPMVMHVVRTLKDAKKRPCIAMRGYRRQNGKSDEADEYMRFLPDTPLAVGPDRVWELRQFFTLDLGKVCDSVVMDDGFQHRRLGRVLDIVLIDASRSPFEDELLPLGWLREPVTSLARAQAVVVTHAEMVSKDELDALLRQIYLAWGKSVTAVCRHVWTGLVTGEGLKRRTVPPSWLKGRRVVLACAVGNPEGVLRSLNQFGPEARTVVLPDHDPFKPKTIQEIVNQATLHRAEAIIVTEKDWSKLIDKPEGTFPCPVLRPQLEMRFDRGQADLDRMVVDAVASFRF